MSKLKKYMQRKINPLNYRRNYARANLNITELGLINGIKYRMADDTLIMDYFIPMVIR